MTNFVLKIIAMITMFCDHLGYALYGKFSSFNYIGRISFPIFAFGISEGYKHTKSKKDYCFRLLLFGVASQAPFMFFNSIFSTGFRLNIFFTLLIGLIAIIGYEKCCEQFKNSYIGLLLVAGLACTADFFKTDYGYFGVLMIFIFHVFKDKKLLMYLSYIALCLVKYVPLAIFNGLYIEYGLLCIWTIVPLIFIHLYNGEKGKSIKYLLYGFYPVHLILLYVFNVVFI
jgi:hypothetical protein